MFDRPYHLVHVEAMKCVAEAFLDRESLLQPTYGFKTNVYAYAKRDLHQGEKLDGIGGYACYGLIENCTDNRVHAGVPICLADEVTLKRDIPKDQKILLEDIVYDRSRQDFQLYAMAAPQLTPGALMKISVVMLTCNGGASSRTSSPGCERNRCPWRWSSSPWIPSPRMGRKVLEEAGFRVYTVERKKFSYGPAGISASSVPRGTSSSPSPRMWSRSTSRICRR